MYNNEQRFIKDIRAYFIHSLLEEKDYKKIADTFRKHMPETIVKKVEVFVVKPKIVYRDRIIFRDVPLSSTKTASELNVGKLLDGHHNGSNLNISDIEDVVCSYLAIEKKDVHTLIRKRRSVLARQYIFFFSRKYTNATMLEIGEAYDRDHTTIVHAVRKISDLLLSHEVTQIDLAAIDTIIKELIEQAKKTTIPFDAKEKFGTLQAVG